MAYSRRIFFFDKLTTRDVKQDKPFTLSPDAPLTWAASGGGFLWMGDANGFLHRMDRGQQIISFKAHSQAVRQVYPLRRHNILLTVGIDENDEERLKVWNVAKWSNKPTPFCYRNTPTGPVGQVASPVTCLFVDEGLQFLLFGHAAGQIQLLRGDITRDRQCKRHLVHTFPSPVTGLGLLLPSASHLSVPDVRNVYRDQSQLQTPVIFATSEQCIMSFTLGKKDEILCKTVLDSFGAALSCSSMVDFADGVPQFAVACKDAVYFYNWDGRGPCLATDGEKLALSVFKNYLILLKGCSGFYLPASGAPIQSHPSIDQSSLATNALEPTVVLIHDWQNKFIAGEFAVQGVCAMFIEWDGIYLLCQVPHTEPQQQYHTLICLIEKSTHEKLELLFSKKSFQLAIDIANSQRLGQEQLARIFSRYADHLYKQKDYDSAIQMYTKTIGFLEASFVIQRFLEGGHIAQLARYLEALSKSELVSSDHLILLLNCYARLQDNDRIDRFVLQSFNHRLNVPAAIRVLRETGFPAAALQLARRTTRLTEEIGISIEDMHEPSQALKRIAQLPFDESLKALCTYGHLLIGCMPKETLEVLDQLCSQPDACRINVHHFLQIFINHRDCLMQFLEHYVNAASPSTKVSGVVDALLELVLYELSNLRNETSSKHAALRARLSTLVVSLLRNNQLPYDPKKALLLCHQRQFFDGCIYLWEQLKLYDQLLRHYMSLDATTEVLGICERFGNEMHKLWLMALRYFSSKPECANELRQVVSEVDRLKLASPLGVLQILCEPDAEHSCHLNTVRDYLLQHLESGANQISSMRDEVQQLRAETMHNREVVRSLGSQVKVFQQQKCALCRQSLEPPSVHFLCDHSYHVLCFENYASGDHQCPACTPKNKGLLSDTAIALSMNTPGISADWITAQLLASLHTKTGASDTASHEAGNTFAESTLPYATTCALIQPTPFISGELPQLQNSPRTMLKSHMSTDTSSMKSGDSSSSRIPPKTSLMLSLDVQPTVASSGPMRSVSTGYYSTDTVPSHSKRIEPALNVGRNPFGDTDTEEEESVNMTEVQLDSADSGIPPNLSTPFD